MCDLKVAEFCIEETFNATCGQGHVVLMTSARFGRWKSGRCISGNVGQLGCWSDVLQTLDNKCSGKRSCYLSVRELIHFQPCSRDYVSYLTTSYICIRITTRDDCTRSSLYSPDSEIGNIVIASNKDIGDNSCPWLRNTHFGRRYNVSVISVGDLSEKTCVETILVIGQASQITGQPIAVKRMRIHCPQHHLLTNARGVDNKVYNRLTTRFITNGNAISFYFRSVGHRRFIVRYNAIGCAIPIQNEEMKVNLAFTTNYTIAGDTLSVHCTRSDTKTEYTCTDRAMWKSRKDQQRRRFPVCRKAPKSIDRMGVVRSKGREFNQKYTMVRGIVVAITIGALLGIVVGSSLLCMIMCVRKRHVNQDLSMPSDHAQLSHHFNTSSRNYDNQHDAYTVKRSSLPAYECGASRSALITYDTCTMTRAMNTTAI